MVLTMPTANPGVSYRDFEGEKVILCLKLVKALFMDSDEVVERHEKMGMIKFEYYASLYTKREVNHGYEYL